ncbi:MAG: L,D-transpeptidase family protein [Mariprofundaceae bacterium]
MNDVWRSVCVCAALVAAGQGAMSAQAAEILDSKDSARILQLLAVQDSETVRAMPLGDLAILRAASELRIGAPEQAISTLQAARKQDQTLTNDPLAAVIEAEAHRRSAIMAVARAGDYARGLADQEKSLQAADLTPGMAEADQRLRAFIDRVDGVYGEPLDLLALSNEVQSVFLVDKGRSRMFVYERDADHAWQRVSDEYVVTGAMAGDKLKEGDKRTPNGVYRFIKKLSGSQLPDRYGPVAFPIDYPNALDRLHHKNGGGIWMHGYAVGVGRRPPRDTKGCFALPNERLLAMAGHVHLGQSWVVVGENLAFGDAQSRQLLADDVRHALQAWSRDWSSRDADAYLTHYHPLFHSETRDFSAWSAYKRRVNTSKSYIHVALDDFTIIRVPDQIGFAQVVVAEFNQNYQSDNYADLSRKRLYLVRDEQSSPWRILLEQSVER